MSFRDARRQGDDGKHRNKSSQHMHSAPLEVSCLNSAQRLAPSSRNQLRQVKIRDRAVETSHSQISHACPRGQPCMTRGQCGSPAHHCMALSSTTPCRFSRRTPHSGHTPVVFPVRSYPQYSHCPGLRRPNTRRHTKRAVPPERMNTSQSGTQSTPMLPAAVLSYQGRDRIHTLCQPVAVRG